MMQVVNLLDFVLHLVSKHTKISVDESDLLRKSAEVKPQICAHFWKTFLSKEAYIALNFTFGF